ncbi:hypothetical protein [Helicobacter sp. T3_23-1056]
MKTISNHNATPVLIGGGGDYLLLILTHFLQNIIANCFLRFQRHFGKSLNTTSDFILGSRE